MNRAIKEFTLEKEATDMKLVCSTLKEIRLKTGKTRYRVGKDLNMRTDTITTIEEAINKTLLLSTLLKLVRYYELTMEEFFRMCHL